MPPRQDRTQIRRTEQGDPQARHPQQTQDSVDRPDELANGVADLASTRAAASPLSQIETPAGLPGAFGRIALSQPDLHQTSSVLRRSAAGQLLQDGARESLASSSSKRPQSSAASTSTYSSPLVAQSTGLPKPGRVFMALENQMERDRISSLMHDREKLAEYASLNRINESVARDDLERMFAAQTLSDDKGTWKDENGVSWADRGDRNKTQSMRRRGDVGRQSSPSTSNSPSSANKKSSGKKQENTGSSKTKKAGNKDKSLSEPGPSSSNHPDDFSEGLPGATNQF